MELACDIYSVRLYFLVVLYMYTVFACSNIMYIQEGLVCVSVCARVCACVWGLCMCGHECGFEHACKCARACGCASMCACMWVVDMHSHQIGITMEASTCQFLIRLIQIFEFKIIFF